MMKTILSLVLVSTIVACGSQKSSELQSATQQENSEEISAETVQDDLNVMDRWNRLVEQNPSDKYDFAWTRINAFPHPTYKGGNADAYEAFIKIYLQFMEQEMDYLVESNLLDYPLHFAYTLSYQECNSQSLRTIISSLKSMATDEQKTKLIELQDSLLGQ